MSKRLKKRIHELCGLINLDREEKLYRANEILNNNEAKQYICNQILGTTFKDVERAMAAILKERQLSNEEIEKLDVELQSPSIIDPELDLMVSKKIAEKGNGSVRYRALTREETRLLMEASEAPVVEPEPEREPATYGTYSREDVERFVREHFEYKEEEKRKAEQWASKKMTASEAKIERRTRHSNSSKD